MPVGMLVQGESTDGDELALPLFFGAAYAYKEAGRTPYQGCGCLRSDLKGIRPIAH